MRVSRLSLAGVVVVALLGGLQAVAAQVDDATVSERAHAVSGTLSLGRTLDEGTLEWDEGRQVHHSRGVAGADPIEMDESRLTGTLWTTWNHDSIGGRHRSGDGEVIAGTYELVNEHGSWVGTKRGYVTLDPHRTHFWHLELTGTDDYLGQSVLLSIHGPAGGPWDVEGLVFPGALPPYPDPVEVPAE